VLTGIPVSGEARSGDEVAVLPGGGRGRVRGIQAYFREVEVARPGHSTGLNVSGVDAAACRRGQVIVPPGTFEPTRLVDARLVLLPAATKPLASGAQVRFHTGTSEVGAKVVVLEGGRIAPGGNGLVQLRLEEPAVVGRFDRFVIRRPSPALTVGGGTVIGPGKSRLRARPHVVEDLERRERAAASDETFVEHLVETAPGGCVARPELARASLLPRSRLGEVLRALLESGRLVEFSSAGAQAFAAARTVGRAREALSRRLAELHAREPESPGLSVRQAAAELGADPRLVEALADGALPAPADDPGFAREGDRVRLASHEPFLAGDDAKALAREVESACREGAYSPPDARELARRLGADEDRLERVVAFLRREGALVRVSPEILFHREHLERARDFVVERLRETGSLGTQELKAFMASSGGTSRKYLVPLLEYFDGIGLTRREGDRRVAGANRPTP
jgi:selenocysteine-specific elongation factor